jgi:hypothetical protein
VWEERRARNAADFRLEQKVRSDLCRELSLDLGQQSATGRASDQMTPHRGQWIVGNDRDLTVLAIDHIELRGHLRCIYRACWTLLRGDRRGIEQRAR